MAQLVDLGWEFICYMSLWKAWEGFEEDRLAFDFKKIPPTQWFSTGGDVAPHHPSSGYLAASGDLWGYHYWGDATAISWAGASCAARHPTEHRTATTTELCSPKCQWCEVGKRCVQCV